MTERGERENERETKIDKEKETQSERKKELERERRGAENRRIEW